ncbi:hypothetical protein B0T16DRAFT_400845 [Cercophora newfieldiana]|uniref:Uncharacterized protein n=1 Tax=Cercophora newfieldiana TaxID=92897 RepID=A0AA39YR20_9PEZI|nr:hypothetical protein B0T16DRAFT_400845 [Cercophora newfieldiana]
MSRQTPFLISLTPSISHLKKTWNQQKRNLPYPSTWPHGSTCSTTFQALSATEPHLHKWTSPRTPSQPQPKPSTHNISTRAKVFHPNPLNQENPPHNHQNRRDGRAV